MDASPTSGADAGSEPLNPEGFAELNERSGEGPVVMLNLLQFKPEGGAERYAEYGAGVAPLLERVGGRALFAGAAGARSPAGPRIGAASATTASTAR